MRHGGDPGPGIRGQELGVVDCMDRSADGSNSVIGKADSAAVVDEEKGCWLDGLVCNMDRCQRILQLERGRDLLQELGG